MLGTTSLSQIFRAHPEFCHDQLKEKNFFSFDQNYKNGKQWYMKTFPHSCSSTESLDATPTYFSDPETPKRLAEYYSQRELRRKKFVLILREPVSRLVGIACIVLNLIIHHQYHNNSTPNTSFDTVAACITSRDIPLNQLQNTCSLQTACDCFLLHTPSQRTPH